MWCAFNVLFILLLSQFYLLYAQVTIFVKKLNHSNQPWWPSVLIHHVSNSSWDRQVDQGLNPTQGMCLYGNIMDPLNSLAKEYIINCPESEMTWRYSNSRAPGGLMKQLRNSFIVYHILKVFTTNTRKQVINL